MTDTAVADAPTTEPPVTGKVVVDELFKNSAWVHVGPGADGCEAIDEAAGTNTCSNRLHFHAWVKIPNQFEHEECREKGLAAQARHIRRLRDENSDAYEVLEMGLDKLRRGGDIAKAELVEELLRKGRWKRYYEAAQDVREYVDPDNTGEGGADIKPFEHVEDDQRTLERLAMQDEADRNQDEFESLARHLTDFTSRLEARHVELLQPEKDALEAKSLDELVDLVREDRIHAEGEEVFTSTYSMWEWLSCTLREPDGRPMFADEKQVRRVAAEVYNALDDTFADLERSQNEGVGSGNS